jgi:membrane protein YqaA with SNARE-associated domain
LSIAKPRRGVYEGADPTAGPDSPMLRRLYDWTMGLAGHRHATAILFVVAFVESSVFPIPPDVLLIPMVLAARSRWLTIALVCTVASVLGGWLGYFIGSGLYEQVGLPVLEFYGYTDKFETFRHAFNDWGAWAVFTAGVTPFPYKVITILSGATALDPTVFTVASVLARGVRFFLVAALLYWFGEPIRLFIEKRLGLVFTVFCVGLIGGFLVLKVFN